MRKVQLLEKLESIKSLTNWQQKLVENISHVLGMKRKAEFDYKMALDGVNRELERYLQADNGFLTDIVKAFQSYVQMILQNQASLVQGYDQDVISALSTLQHSQEGTNIFSRAQFFDDKMRESQAQILKLKELIRSNQVQLKVLASQYKLGDLAGQHSKKNKQEYAQRFADLQRLKNINEEALQSEVDGIMNLTTQHDALLSETECYGQTILQQRGMIVFDTFMKAFVLQVSYIKSLQHDVFLVLQRVKDGQENVKQVEMEKMRNYKEKEGSKIKGYLLEKLKLLAKENVIHLNQSYISQRIRGKWNRICEYFEHAK